MRETGMPELDQLLTSGRDAFARRDWPAVASSLAAAARRAPLATGDLEALASSSWWLGNVPEALAGAEELYRRLTEAGDPTGAAMTAINLGLRWGTRGDLEGASGWLNRARRSLQGLEDATAYGYLLYVEASMSLDFEDDGAPPASAAAALEELSRSSGDRTLQCFARVLSGLARVRSGETEAGFGDLDEAMLPSWPCHSPPQHLAVLEARGTFLMVDIKASSNLEDNIDLPWAAFLYAISTTHCMSVSLAQGGDGLGAPCGVCSRPSRWSGMRGSVMCGWWTWTRIPTMHTLWGSKG